MALFSELGLCPEVLKAVEEMGYETPSEIQERTIPLLMEGKDVIGRSNTGTGKTAAFGIPAVESIPREDCREPKVLILCPTRELAMQACGELVKFSKYMKWVRPVAVYGGAPMEKQIYELKRGANIVVGTPGRIMDHLRRRTLKLENLSEVILDEADEMLNMGFREDIETILKSVPENRQTVLFSATMPPAILAITREFQTDPTVVKVQNKAQTVDSVCQYYYDVPMGRKTDALQLLLLTQEPGLSMVFCNTKKMVDELTEALCSKGFKAAGLHGDMKQSQRTSVMNAFKTGRVSILIATDVAARGIDVTGIDSVFNYDLPQDTEYYVHRIGRTGRAGKSGVAYTLISGRKQFYQLKDIMKATKAEINPGELPSSEDVKIKKSEKLKEKVIACISHEKQGEGKTLLAKLNEEGYSSEDVASALLSMRLAKDLKSIPEFVRAVPKTDYKGQKVKMKKIELSVGRSQRMAPNFILGALADSTGMSGREFGKIDIFDRFTTVEVPAADVDHVIECLDGGKINGNHVSVKLHEGRRDDKRKPPYGRKKPAGNDGAFRRRKR